MIIEENMNFVDMDMGDDMEFDKKQWMDGIKSENESNLKNEKVNQV